MGRRTTGAGWPARTRTPPTAKPWTKCRTPTRSPRWSGGRWPPKKRKTVERLLDRIGRLPQPILAQLPRTIAGAVISGAGRERLERAGVTDAIERQAREAEAGGFDLDAALDADVTLPDRPPSPATLDDPDRVIRSPDLMPPGTDVRPLAPREYGLLAPGMRERLRVTTDPAWYEEHAESVELWSPGNPLFQAPELVATPEGSMEQETLKEIRGW